MTTHTDKYGRPFVLIRHEGRVILHVGDSTGLDIVQTDGWELLAEIRTYLEDYARQKEEWKKLGMTDKQFKLWKDNRDTIFEKRLKEYMESPVHALNVEYGNFTLCDLSTMITNRASKAPDEITCPECLEKIRLIRIETRKATKPKPKTPMAPSNNTVPAKKTKPRKKLRTIHQPDPYYTETALCGLRKEQYPRLKIARSSKAVNCMNCLRRIDELIKKNKEEEIRQAIQDYNDGKLEHLKKGKALEEKFKNMYEDYFSTIQIANELKLTTTSIRNRAKRNGWPLPEERIKKKAKELAESDLHIKKCLEQLPGMNERKFENLRRRYNYKIGGKNKRTCSDCGKTFYVPTAMKRCEECWEINEQVKSMKYNLRMNYLRLAYDKPEQAEEMVKDMEIAEGKDFREFALNGLPEKMKKKEADEQ